MKITIILSLLMMGSCAFAPMMSHRSGKTIGKDKNRIQASPGISVLGVSYERGVSENWDMGASLEQQLGTVGSVFTKYALVNSEQGVSWAMSGGGFVGSGISNASGAYGGSVVSWRKDSFELFIFPRFNHVKWHGTDLSTSESDRLILDDIDDASDRSINYAQVSLGFNVYLERTFYMGFGASYFNFFHNGQGAWLPEVVLGWDI